MWNTSHCIGIYRILVNLSPFMNFTELPRIVFSLITLYIPSLISQALERKIFKSILKKYIFWDNPSFASSKICCCCCCIDTRSGNILPPSAFSRRAVVSYWRKYVHEVLVNRLGGLSPPRKSVVRLTDRPDMTLDVYPGRKTTIQYKTLQH